MQLFLSPAPSLLLKAFLKQQQAALKKASSVFEPQFVLVPNVAVANYLKEHLAATLSIAANFNFIFLNKLVEILKHAMLKADSSQAATHSIPQATSHATPSTADPEVMQWALLKLITELRRQALPQFNNKNTAPPEWLQWLGHYFSEAATQDPEKLEEKSYYLSRTLADLFDQYNLYRPQWIEQWGRGDNFLSSPEAFFQAELWRRLKQRFPGSTRSEELRWLWQQVEKQPPAFLPFKSLCVFGLSYLPPEYLKGLVALSKKVALKYYYLSPVSVAPLPAATPAAFIFKALCRQGSDFLTQLQELGVECHFLPAASVPPVSLNPPPAPPKPRLLELLRFYCTFPHLKKTAVSEHIAALALALKTALSAPQAPAAKSFSFEVHVAPNLLREVSVLKQNLIRLFQADPSLMPDEVLVMAPEINDYVFLVESVFDSQAHSPALPYVIFDKTETQADSLAKAFLCLLDLLASKFEFSKLSALLEQRAFQNTFNLSLLEAEELLSWLRALRVAWGRHEKDRAEFHSFLDNSLKAGVAQLLSAYLFFSTTLPSGEDNPVFSLPPSVALREEDNTLLEKALFLLRQLSLESALSFQKKTWQAWRETLTGLLNQFFPVLAFSSGASQAFLKERRELQQTLETLVEQSSAAGCQKEIFSFSLVRSLLEHKLTQKKVRYGAKGGGITFSSLLPMRNLPFRVIYLLGMTEDAYPRLDVSTPFNLLLKAPCLGDRSKLFDDHYLFLEILLSAKEQLFLSYTTSEALPTAACSSGATAALGCSPLLQKLLSYFSQQLLQEEKTFSELGLEKLQLALKNYLFRFHPLFNFDPAYFSPQNSLGRSHSRRAYELALYVNRTSAASPAPRVVSIQRPDSLPPPPLLFEEVQACFKAPLHHYLTKRLQLAPSPLPPAHRFGNSLSAKTNAKTSAKSNEETLSLSGLVEHQLQQAMLFFVLKDQPPSLAAVKRTTLLPVGSWGEVAYERLDRKMRQLSKTLRVLCETQLHKNFLPQLLSGALPSLEKTLTLSFPRSPTRADATATPKPMQTGRLSLSRRVSSRGALYYRAFKLKFSDLMVAWLEHLFQAALDETTTFKTLVVALEESYCFQPLPSQAAKDSLQRFLSYYTIAASLPLPPWDEYQFDREKKNFRAFEASLPNYEAVLRDSKRRKWYLLYSQSRYEQLRTDLLQELFSPFFKALNPLPPVR